MFVAERRRSAASSVAKRGAKSPPKTSLSVEQLLKARRRELHRQVAGVVDREKELAALRRRRDGLVARHQRRLRMDANEQICSLEERLARLRSGEEAKAFEARAAKYMKRHQLFMRDERDDARGAPPTPHRQRAGSLSHELHADRSMCASRAEVVQVYNAGGDVCVRCQMPMVVLSSEALLACPGCKLTRVYAQATSSRIAYGDEVEFTSFSYKRQNHFQEWLNSFQAKEGTEIPQTVLNQVMDELYRRRILDVNRIVPKKVREVLKDLKLWRYYEHTAQITSRISGRPPPRMSPQQEEQCRLMFAAIQQPFDKHCPPDRRNFLSYSFCLFKFVQLLGWDEFLPCFSLLKGRDKLLKQDVIFKNICMELGWEFIPSV